MVRTSLAALALSAGLLAGCVPYAVGTTAATAAPRRVEPSAVVQIASADRDLSSGGGAGGPTASLANEARFGLDERSDVGLRLIGVTSLVVSYKRRLTGTGEAGTALLVGAGVVGADQVHLEATLVASGAPRGPLLPYGGVRVQDLTPFAGDALATSPAVGAFGGVRIGWPDLALSPELGVFYSPSPYRDQSSVIVVPSVTVRGERLLRALGLGT